MGDVYAASIEAGLSEVLQRVHPSDGNQPTNGPPVFAADIVQRTMMLSSALFFIFGRWPGTLFVGRDEIESHVAEEFTNRDGAIGLIGNRPFSKNTSGIQRGFLKSIRAAIWSNADAGAQVYRELNDQMRLVCETVPYFTDYFTHKRSEVYIESLADSLYTVAQHVADRDRAASTKGRRTIQRPVEDAEGHSSEAAAAASSSAAAASAVHAGGTEPEDAAPPKKALPKKRPAVTGAASAAAARPAKRVVKVTSTDE